MTCVGIVGGLGVGATVHYYEKIAAACKARDVVPDLVITHADVDHGQSLVRELEPQVNEGDDDPVGERQVMGRPGAGRAKPLVAPACEQPVLLSSRPRSGHLLDEPG